MLTEGIADCEEELDWYGYEMRKGQGAVLMRIACGSDDFQLRVINYKYVGLNLGLLHSFDLDGAYGFVSAKVEGLDMDRLFSVEIANMRCAL